jgi:hypothetical protein
MLWAPWASGQNQISESKVYLQINKHAESLPMFAEILKKL